MTVDDYVEQMPSWQRDLAQQVRELVLGLDPEVTETIKRSVQPYFVLQGNICALLTTKDHLNVPALSAMLRQIIANNRAGGWRALKRT